MFSVGDIIKLKNSSGIATRWIIVELNKLDVKYKNTQHDKPIHITPLWWLKANCEVVDSQRITTSEQFMKLLEAKFCDV